ncbi:MAG TPA: hypothetical protein VF174_13165 [Micromonosporaceae bacterium]
MSIVEELGSRVRAAADELPVGLVRQALLHLSKAAERLQWVRQESVNPMGVPELSGATEHGEAAGYALRVAQEQLAAYLAAIGLAGRQPAAPSVRADHPVEPAVRVPPPPVPGWWSERVAALTGRPASDGGPSPARDAQELLQRMTAHLRTGNRTRLYAELRAVDPDVGLGLSAVSTPALRRATEQVLGHPPRPADLSRLRGLAAGVRELLPGLPADVVDTLLSRVCRTPPPRSAQPPHPADQAVAAGVFAGLLLVRLDQEADPDGADA